MFRYPALLLLITPDPVHILNNKMAREYRRIHDDSNRIYYKEGRMVFFSRILNLAEINRYTGFNVMTRTLVVARLAIQPK